jgi:hypothetical protein
MSQRFNVHVDRCWRHRGDFSLENFFVIGRQNHRFWMRIMPMAYLSLYLPAIEKEFAIDAIIKWAEGELTPSRIRILPSLYQLYQPHFRDIRFVLREAFLARRADQRLEDFLQAHVYIADEPLHCTIADLLASRQLLH